jgi:hypothetical protein
VRLWGRAPHPFTFAGQHVRIGAAARFWGITLSDTDTRLADRVLCQTPARCSFALTAGRGALRAAGSTDGIQVDQGVARKAKQKPESEMEGTKTAFGSTLSVPPDSVIGVVKIGVFVAGSGGSGALSLAPVPSPNCHDAGIASERSPHSY